VAGMAERRNAYAVWWVNMKENRPLRILRRRKECSSTMDLKEMRLAGVDWVYLAQNRDKCRTVLSTVTSLLGPLNVKNFLPTSGTVSISRRTWLHEFTYLFIYLVS
jgi:hypothetical protein